jgi:hypothetical protein
MTDKKFNVFISYSHHDQDFVDQLTQGLEAEGVTVWSDRSIQPGSNWIEEIEGGLEQSRHFLLVVSQESLNSPSINFEIGIALSKAAKSPDTLVIPVLNMNPREVGSELGVKLHQILTDHKTSSNSYGL